MTVLQLDGLDKSFGGVHATHNVSLKVARNELLALIGPNGAGKTTLLKLVTGNLKPDRGQVLLDGKNITELPTHRRARLGMIMTHQIVRPFGAMTLKENVMVATASRYYDSPRTAIWKRPNATDGARAMQLLDRVGIVSAADRNAREVPLGFLKRLQIARALAAGPSILLLDEPLAGLNHGEAERIADLISELNREGLTIILIEHNLGEVLRISQRLAVLDNGSLLAEGDPQQTIRLPQVRAAYLGTKSDAA